MAKTRARKSSLADYDRPPVSEVVFGVKFAPLAGWKLPHVGAFWQQVLDEFPQCEHAPPLTDPDFADPGTGLPLPRVWLINRSDDRLIQLQPGRFLFNWRYRENVGPYPRYENLSKAFFTLFRDFRKFVGEHRLGQMTPLEYELSYVNRVYEQEGWTFPEHMGRVVDQVGWREGRYRFLPHPLVITWQARFAFQGRPGQLVVKLAPARQTKGEKQSIVLELSARGLPAETPLDHLEDWFSEAHEWIVRGFEDLTSDAAQKELWGKRD